MKANGRKIRGAFSHGPIREKCRNSDFEWILSSNQIYKLPIQYQPFLKIEYEQSKGANTASMSQLRSQLIERDTTKVELRRQLEESAE